MLLASVLGRSGWRHLELLSLPQAHRAGERGLSSLRKVISYTDLSIGESVGAGCGAAPKSHGASDLTLR